MEGGGGGDGGPGGSLRPPPSTSTSPPPSRPPFPPQGGQDQEEADAFTASLAALELPRLLPRPLTGGSGWRDKARRSASLRPLSRPCRKPRGPPPGARCAQKEGCGDDWGAARTAWPRGRRETWGPLVSSGHLLSERQPPGPEHNVKSVSGCVSWARTNPGCAVLSTLLQLLNQQPERRADFCLQVKRTDFGPKGDRAE